MGGPGMSLKASERDLRVMQDLTSILLEGGGQVIGSKMTSDLQANARPDASLLFPKWLEMAVDKVISLKMTRENFIIVSLGRENFIIVSLGRKNFIIVSLGTSSSQA